MRAIRVALIAHLALIATTATAQARTEIVDLPTRDGVTQRLLVLDAPSPRAAAILFAGGHGGLRIGDDGEPRWGRRNFLVRSRALFVERGVTVAIIDTPSDRASPPFLAGFRQSAGHVADVRAVIAWLRERTRAPVWLVGTSRGTQSAAFVATALPGADGPDGVVLTASILRDDRGRPVTAMPLERVRVPVLVVHHEDDACRACPFARTSDLMARLAHVARRELLPIRGGASVGDPCEALAHHGFNGREEEVVERTVAWMLAR